MPRAREWADNFELGIKVHGFSTEQIHRYKDVDSSTMNSIFLIRGANSIKKKVIDNSRQGRRTLLLCFYAGHGATKNGKTRALLNHNKINAFLITGGQFDLEEKLDDCAKLKGAYVISLLVCDRINCLPEVARRARRGGADPEATVPRPVGDAGQGIMIQSVSEGDWITSETPSLE